MSKKVFVYLSGMLFMCSFVLAEPNFQIDIQDSYGILQSDVLYSGGKGIVGVEVQNLGSTGTMKVECGIYRKETINKWYGSNVFSVVSDVENCIENQKNVDTKNIELSSGDSKVVSFSMSVPKVVGFFESTNEYAIHCQAFKNCWTPTTKVGATDFDVKEITIKRGLFSGEDETCTDGVKNQDETDTDCGGELCDKCNMFEDCLSDTDCEKGLECREIQSDYTATGKVCVDKDQECLTDEDCLNDNLGDTCSVYNGINVCVWENPIPPPTCGNGRCQTNVGETCNNCPSDCGDCKDPFPEEVTYYAIAGLIFIVAIAIIVVTVRKKGKRRR